MAFESVWLVDDDELSNYVNERIIKAEKFAGTIVIFTEVRKALEALALAGHQPEYAVPDVIFLDMDMPALDGWDFLDAFEQLPGRVKGKSRLYMLSSSINKDDAYKARKYTCLSDYLFKPLTPEELKEISSTIPGKQAKQASK